MGRGRSRHPGQVNRSASQARCSTVEVSRLLPLAGACGVVVVVCTPLLVMELLQITTALSTGQIIYWRHSPRVAQASSGTASCTGTPVGEDRPMQFTLWRTTWSIVIRCMQAGLAVQILKLGKSCKPRQSSQRQHAAVQSVLGS